MINLGINRCGNHVAMTQKLPNLRQRCPAAQHLRRGSVAQPMSMDKAEAALFCGACNDHAHRGIGESLMWR
jgi:hypothetical protein